MGQRVTETEANRQAREPQAVANGELRPDWKARETGRTTTRFEREQELARQRGFRTAHEMRKARNKRSKARYSPPLNEQPEPMDRFAQVPGPVRWIMRDGKPVHQPSNER